MVIRESADGPDLPQPQAAVTAPRAGVPCADLPKLKAPEWGKVEKKPPAPIPCFIRDQHGGLHRAQVVGLECDSGRGPPASYVCRSCRNAFDDPAQEGIAAALIQCPNPKCKKTGVEIYPADRLGASYAVKGGPGVTVYLVQQLETQSEMLVDDPENPGKKKAEIVNHSIAPEDRTSATLTADRIELA